MRQVGKHHIKSLKEESEAFKGRAGQLSGEKSLILQGISKSLAQLAINMEAMMKTKGEDNVRSQRKATNGQIGDMVSNIVKDYEKFHKLCEREKAWKQAGSKEMMENQGGSQDPQRQAAAAASTGVSEPVSAVTSTEPAQAQP